MLIGGILRSTVTGTRRGSNTSVSSLGIAGVFMSRNPDVGHVVPHTGNHTSHVLGHADRVAIIISSH